MLESYIYVHIYFNKKIVGNPITNITKIKFFKQLTKISFCTYFLLLIKRWYEIRWGELQFPHKDTISEAERILFGLYYILCDIV